MELLSAGSVTSEDGGLATSKVPVNGGGLILLAGENSACGLQARHTHTGGLVPPEGLLCSEHVPGAAPSDLKLTQES